MPLYEYTCEACGHTFEELHGASETPCVACAACGHAKTERLMPRPNLKHGATPFDNLDYSVPAPRRYPGLNTGGCPGAAGGSGGG